MYTVTSKLTQKFEILIIFNKIYIKKIYFL